MSPLSRLKILGQEVTNNTQHEITQALSELEATVELQKNINN